MLWDIVVECLPVDVYTPQSDYPKLGVRPEVWEALAVVRARDGTGLEDTLMWLTDGRYDD